MTQHFTRNTVAASLWCAKCQKQTLHRIDGVLRGPCLDCIARVTVQSAQNELDRRREVKQGDLFR